MRVTALAALLIALACGGCAMIEHGTVESIKVTSDPPGARVTAATGGTCITPCSLELPRKDDVSISVVKHGYQEQSIQLIAHSTASDADVSPELTPDYLGRVVDAQYSVHFVHRPNPVHLKLDPTPPPS